MEIEFRKAVREDAETLIGIYNASFYSDYVKYGECPAYGRTREMMEQSILEYPKFLILCQDRPVGCVSCKETGSGTYEVGCLCVIPEFQGKGIGTSAMEFMKSCYPDWKRFTLITPVDKQENGDKRHRFKDKRSDRNIRILLKPLIEPFHSNGVQNDREAQNDEQHPVCSHMGNEEYAKSYRCIGNKCSDQV